MKRVCVFASSSRYAESYLQQAAQLGTAFVEAGIVCVNGAGNTGCMEALRMMPVCKQAVRSKGHLAKIFRRTVTSSWFGNDGGCETMRERKRRPGEQVDAYVVLPVAQAPGKNFGK